MTTKQDKKNTPLFPGGRMATQEDCIRINNGEATQIVLNRRVKRPRGNKPNPTSGEVNKDG